MAAAFIGRGCDESIQLVAGQTKRPLDWLAQFTVGPLMPIWHSNEGAEIGVMRNTDRARTLVAQHSRQCPKQRVYLVTFSPPRITRLSHSCAIYDSLNVMGVNLEFGWGYILVSPRLLRLVDVVSDTV
jgi:hypothetical protein